MRALLELVLQVALLAAIAAVLSRCGTVEDERRPEALVKCRGLMCCLVDGGYCYVQTGCSTEACPPLPTEGAP